MNLVSGSLRLGQIFGISVFVHWSWLVVGVLEMQWRADKFSSPFWNIAEYISLFVIVLLHEFGHALACRSVGGFADEIVLWPLGGVAFVSPPRRPGPVLWSIAAGPLVNVALLVPTFALLWYAGKEGWDDTQPDLFNYIWSVTWLNFLLLVFNLLPIYPLDGGQILQSLLWFILGQAWSLYVACAIGLVGAIGLGYWGFLRQDRWMMIIGAYLAYKSILGFQAGKATAWLATLPRRKEFACPKCTESPFLGQHWACGECGKVFDSFEGEPVCPNCHARQDVTTCPWCRQSTRIADWSQSPRDPASNSNHDPEGNHAW